MAAITHLNRRRTTAAKAVAQPLRRRMPPSAMLITVVLEYADLRDDMGGGRVMLRFSPMRLAQADIQAMLADEAERAGDVAVIWDEREDEIFRVLDGGAAAQTAATMEIQPEPFAYETAAEPEAFDEDDQFVLTPAALQYLAESAARKRW